MKNKILISITWFCALLFTFCGVCLDSTNYILPIVIMLLCLCWLIPMGIANKVIGGF